MANLKALKKEDDRCRNIVAELKLDKLINLPTVTHLLSDPVLAQ